MFPQNFWPDFDNTVNWKVIFVSYLMPANKTGGWTHFLT
jgi:hypothetical protein